MFGIGIVKAVLGFFTGVGGANPVKTWATIILIAALSFGFGNVFANQRAVAIAAREAGKIVADKAARDQAAQGIALINRDKEATAKHNRDDQIAHVADDHAHETLQNSATAAERAAADARQALALERQRRNQEPKNVTINSPAACPLAVPFSWPGSIRVFLDAAAGADSGSASDRAAENSAAGGALRATAATGEAARLTPDDLADGYSSLGKHDRVCLGKLNASQDWIEERLRER